MKKFNKVTLRGRVVTGLMAFFVILSASEGVKVSAMFHRATQQNEGNGNPESSGSFSLFPDDVMWLVVADTGGTEILVKRNSRLLEIDNALRQDADRGDLIIQESSGPFSFSHDNVPIDHIIHHYLENLDKRPDESIGLFNLSSDDTIPRCAGDLDKRPDESIGLFNLSSDDIIPNFGEDLVAIPSYTKDFYERLNESTGLFNLSSDDVIPSYGPDLCEGPAKSRMLSDLSSRALDIILNGD